MFLFAHFLLFNCINIRRVIGFWSFFAWRRLVFFIFLDLRLNFIIFTFSFFLLLGFFSLFALLFFFYLLLFLFNFAVGFLLVNTLAIMLCILYFNLTCYFFAKYFVEETVGNIIKIFISCFMISYSFVSLFLLFLSFNQNCMLFFFS